MILLLLFLLGLGAHGSACPDTCTCRWKGGKQMVECINKSLNTIPSGMDQNTQVLDFSGNNLNRLQKNKFKTLGLINLQKVLFPRCRIKTIDKDAFKGLSNLVELDLSDNLVSAVPTETFQDYPLLMRLSLNGNPIESLRSQTFRSLSYLTNLELSNCQLKVVEDGAFDGLNSLEWLKLDNNKLKFVKGNNILPENLHGIDLHHNPWHCDCNLIDLRAWLIGYNVPQSIEPVCESPTRLKNKALRSLFPDELACKPEVRPTTLYLEIAEGKNVSLECKVSAIPEAKVSWWYQGEVLQNDSTVAPGLHLYYFLEEGRTEKTSELFIFNTNAEDNGTFVCIAENQAGRSHSNYTVRILLKPEPMTSLTVFPNETLYAISAGAGVLVLVVLMIVTLCGIQCTRQKKRKKKKDRSKVVALQGGQQQDKTPVPREEAITRLSSAPTQKANGNLCPDMKAFNSGNGVLVLPNTLTYNNPGQLSQAYLEKNPDLISDTGSKEWKQEGLETDKAWNGTLPRRELFPKQLAADVHLTLGKFVDAEGYPLDYGLPKLPGPFPMGRAPPPAFYRTLPHKVRTGGQARFSREAECVHYTPDIRYTAEGYPCYQGGFVPVQAVGAVVGPCYRSADVGSQWPESGLDSVQPVVPNQTAGPEPPLERQELTESPDEGYVGDGVEATLN